MGPQDADNLDLETVFTLSNPTKAEIIKNFLESEGISCFLEGVRQAALSALPIHVQVPAADAERARALIAEHEDRPEDDEPEGDEPPV